MNSVNAVVNAQCPATGRKRRKKIRQSTVDDQPVIRELVARFPLFLFSAPSPMKLGVNAELQQFCRAAIPEELMSRTRVRLAVNYFRLYAKSGWKPMASEAKTLTILAAP